MKPYDFILQTIKSAGGLLIEERDKGFDTRSKGGDVRDMVTSVDIAVNTFIVNEIKKAFPEHSIYSEEEGDSNINTQNEHKWAIDPIDGSSNFARGIPHYAVCIGLLRGGIPIAGAVYNPVTKELFSFNKGKGVFLNGKPIHVTDTTDLSLSHVFFHAGRKESVRDWGGESYRRLLGGARKVTNPASSALDICSIAAGRVEATVYGTLTALDIASALGILIEAGGVISDAQGGALLLTKDPQKIYMANNKATLDQVRNLLES